MLLYPIKYKIDSRLKFIIERLSPNIRGITPPVRM